MPCVRAGCALVCVRARVCVCVCARQGLSPPPSPGGLGGPPCGAPGSGWDQLSEEDVVFPAHPAPLALDRPGAPAGLRPVSPPPRRVCCARVGPCGPGVRARGRVRCLPRPRFPPLRPARWFRARLVGCVVLISASPGGLGASSAAGALPFALHPRLAHSGRPACSRPCRRGAAHPGEPRVPVLCWHRRSFRGCR